MQVKKHIILVLKIIAAVSVYAFVIYKIINSSDLHEIPEIVRGWDIVKFLSLILLIFLMLINWGIETYKWQAILPGEIRICFKNSFKAVFTGIALGNLTPNRIGEFGGRILFIKDGHKKKAVAYTIIADISQLITTLVLGITAFFFLGYKTLADSGFSVIMSQTILAVGILIALFTIIIFYNLNNLPKLIAKIRFFKKYKEAMDDICGISKLNLTKVLGLSFLRFVIFIFQFYIALDLFDIEISLFNTFLAVANIYLLTTIIPNIPFTEVGIRSAFSIIFLSLFSDSATSIVLASLLVFIVNIGIPSLIGSLFLIKSKV